MDSGQPVAQQRRRLQVERQPSTQAGRYLFGWEKKPAKLLPFVSAGPSQWRRSALAVRPHCSTAMHLRFLPACSCCFPAGSRLPRPDAST